MVRLALNKALSVGALAALCLSLCTSTDLLAQVPSARLHGIFPPGGQAGTELEVSVNGADLDDATGLRFSHPGIQGIAKVSGEDRFLGKEIAADQFVVTIAKDVPVGEYEVRVVGAFGVSSPRRFAVDHDKQYVEKEGNNDIASATSIEDGGVVSGRANNGTDLDYFKVHAKAGRWLIVDALAHRIDSRLEAELSLYDAQGIELATRARGSDPYLEYKIEKDGDYFVSIRDRIYRGGNEYFYRLRVTTGAHVFTAFPSTLRSGTESEIRFYGRNLPDAKPDPELKHGANALEYVSRKIKAPGQSAGLTTTQSEGAFVDRFAARASVQLPPSEIGLSPFPVVIESADNDVASTATKVSAPCEVNGRFYPRGDRDWIEFEAEKGAVLRLDLISHRLGLRVDPYMVVYRVIGEGEKENNQEIKRVDDQSGISSPYFNAATDDPEFRFVAPAKGRYRVQVRDLYGDSQGDPRSTYRLVIRPEAPSFRLVSSPRSPELDNDGKKNQPRDATLFLRPGESGSIEVLVHRIDGFNQAIELIAKDLPAGVSFWPTTIAASQKSVVLFVRAATDAKPWAGSLKLMGKAKVGDKELEVAAQSAVVTWTASGQRGLQSRLTNELPLAIAAHEKFVEVQPESDVIVMSRGGKAKIPVKLIKNLPLKGKTSVGFSKLPGNVGWKRIEIEEKNDSGTLELDINEKAALGDSLLVLHVRGQVAYSRGAHKLPAANAKKAELEKLVPEVTKSLELAKAAKKKLDTDLGVVAEALKKAEAAVTASQSELVAIATAPPAEEGKTNKEKIEAATAALIAKVEERTRAKDKNELLSTQATEANKAVTDQGATVALAAKSLEKIKKRTTDLSNAAKPKNLRFCSYSVPFTLRIVDAPIKLSAADKLSVKKGAKASIEVKIERLFGFADEVALSVQIPKGAKGLKVANAKIAKDKTSIKLEFEATADAAPGELASSVHAELTFNGKKLKTTVPLKLTVTP